ALSPVLDRVVDGRADETLGSLTRNGLDAKARAFGETDLRKSLGEVLLEHLRKLLRVLLALLKLDACVDVFGVFTEDHRVHQLRLLHRARDAVEIAHGAKADVHIEKLPKRNVQRADAAADRRRKRALDADEILTECLNGLVREPVLEILKRFFPRVHLVPSDRTLAAIGFLDGGVEYTHRGSPNITPGAVSLNERNDRTVTDDEYSIVPHTDRIATRGFRDFHHETNHQESNQPL